MYYIILKHHTISSFVAFRWPSDRFSYPYNIDIEILKRILLLYYNRKKKRICITS